MRKLTIGSLKDSSRRGDIEIAAAPLDKQTFKVIKRLLQLEQNHSRYQIEVNKDQTILDAAFEQNIELEYKCRKGTCGQCKVKIIKGRNLLTEANQAEEKKLQNLLNNGFRLACQAKGR